VLQLRCDPFQVQKLKQEIWPCTVDKPETNPIFSKTKGEENDPKRKKKRTTNFLFCSEGKHCLFRGIDNVENNATCRERRNISSQYFY
jgi:hypothetical protein